MPGNPVPRLDMKPCKHLYPVCKRIANGILIKNKGFVVFDIGLTGSQIQQAFFLNFMEIFTKFLPMLRKFSNFAQFCKHICEKITNFHYLNQATILSWDKKAGWRDAPLKPPLKKV